MTELERLRAALVDAGRALEPLAAEARQFLYSAPDESVVFLELQHAREADALLTRFRRWRWWPR